MDDVIRLKKITAWTAMLIAVTVMIVIPAVYMLASYRYQSLWLQSRIDYNANKISEIIYSYPDSWEYQEYRLKDILSLTQSKYERINYKILKSNNEVLLESGAVKGFLLQSVEGYISDGEKNVGKIIISVSIMPLINEMMVVFIVGLFLAITVYFALRLLPFAALAKTTQSLIDSRKEITNEVKEKNKALEEQHRISEKMRYQALHDALTGLPNRKKYYKALHDVIEENLSEKSNFWVVIIDLDRFKEINDSLGHMLGDVVLQEIANRLVKNLPQDIMVARLGGDEYALLVPQRKQAELEEILVSIVSNIRMHINTEGFHLSVDASLGISEFPHHGVSQENLMRHADIAMYHAKSSGKDWAYYDHRLDKSTPNRLKLTADLRHALDCELLELYYQPKILLQSNQVIGMEALARWKHPEYGFISPDVFIPIAEQTSMIMDLTRWVFTTSLKTLKFLHQCGYDQLSMAINISARNLQDERFCDEIEQYLKNENMSAKNITLEITETSIMNDPEQSQIIVQRLADLGLEIAIDDFGTGYSSLSYLKKLAAKQVKIDRSFVMNLLSDNDDYIIVESTIGLAHSLGMEVVAEGVEDVETNNALIKMDCECAQGYYYSRPMDAGKLEEWLLKFNNKEAI